MAGPDQLPEVQSWRLRFIGEGAGLGSGLGFGFGSSFVASSMESRDALSRGRQAVRHTVQPALAPRLLSGHLVRDQCRGHHEDGCDSDDRDAEVAVVLDVAGRVAAAERVPVSGERVCAKVHVGEGPGVHVP
ncbi:hypothetical protein GCM10023080_080980 [Streptomyces pseudoechinosporeus]